MKIAYIYQDDGRSFERPYAPHIHILNIIRGLQKRGHDVRLMTLYGNREVMWTDNLDAALNGELEPSRDLARLHVTDHPLFKAGESAIRRTQVALRLPYLALFDSMRIYEACIRHMPDVDVIHERYKLQAVGGSMAGKRIGVPVVLEVNGDSMNEWALRGQPVTGIRKRYATWANHFAFRRADRVICVSNELRAHLANRWQLDEGRVTVLPNGADIEEFGRTPESNAALARFGIHGSPVVIVVGGFFEWHDLNSVLESFKLTLDSWPDATLVLVGDGDTRAAVADMAQTLGIGDSVQFTGQVKHELIPKLLAAADIAVVPLKAVTNGYGASPLKLYEYMAAGKAIIASRTGQNTEVITHGRTGLFYESGDVHSLFEMLTRLMDDPQLRRQLGANAREEAIRKHSWDTYAEKLERIYEDAIQRSS